YEYKFFINNYFWLSDPDNPLMNPRDNNNSIINVWRHELPYFENISPGDGTVIYDSTTVQFSARVKDTDYRRGIDPSTISLILDGNSIPHTYNPATGIISAVLEFPSTGRYILKMTAADSAGRSDTAKIVYGVFSSATGYHYLDSVEDDVGDGDYTYPDGVLPGSCDLESFEITADDGLDSLRFIISLANISPYTKVVLQINSSMVKNVVDGVFGVELKSVEWNGTGVFIPVMAPDSPYFEEGVDNVIYTGRKPLTAGSSIEVNSDAAETNRFVFSVSMADLIDVLGSYKEEWFFCVYSFLDGVGEVKNGATEVSENLGGIDEDQDPDVYDVMFVESAELQSRLLKNYSGTRIAALDAVGRGFAAVSADEIAPGLGSPGPMVTILTRGAETILPEVTIKGEVDDLSISQAILYQNGVPISMAVSNGYFSEDVTLVEGSNVFRATATNDSGYTGFSSKIIFTLIVDHSPRGEIKINVEGDRIILDASGSMDPDNDPLNFLWVPDPENPENITLSDPTRALTAFQRPDSSGEYYFNLTVTDVDGNTDYSRCFIAVTPDTVYPAKINDNPQWVKDAIVYEIYVRSFSQSGTFSGVKSLLESVSDLGVTVLWFMPINEGPSTHGYEITDYYDVESDYGTPSEFRDMVDRAKDLGLKVILDLVINHTSVQHPFMKDAKQFGVYSHYYDYYDRAADTPGENYEPTWGYTYYYDWVSLPNLDYTNMEVERYFVDVSKYWIQTYDIDGYRCDVAWGPQLRTPNFWVKWRSELKRIKPDVLLLAEANASEFDYFNRRFDLAYDWPLYHESFKVMFDGTPNINKLHNLILNYGYSYPASGYPLRFLENHDEFRYISKYSIEQTRLMAALLFTIPGVPLIYAGQEVGELSQRGRIDWSDPDNLRHYYRRLIEIRKSYSSLRSKGLKRIQTGSSRVYSFYRKDDNNIVITAFNFSSQSLPVVLNIPVEDLGIDTLASYYMNDVLHQAAYRVVGSDLSNYKIIMEGYDAKIFVLADTAITSLKEDKDFLLSIPREYNLLQNFPNPFNSSTIIKYQIPEAIPVILKVYDILGRQVRILIDGKRSAGEHLVSWDGKNMEGKEVPSGIYFYRLMAGDFIETRKMVILK
ncbi:MAG: alpha-amylase family glycosyl hydrolase, partial [Fidelibacterota bacterium]